MTAKKIVWEYLKTRPSGYKFKKKYPLSIYTVDFFCFELKLIIEIDEAADNEEEVIIINTDRQKMMDAMGISILRFTKNEVVTQQQKVIEKITKFLHD